MFLLKRIKELLKDIRKIKDDAQEARLLAGAILANSIGNAKSLKDSEFKVFSQYGDDGIIQFLINKLSIEVDKFVEFGVENYEESNTRFLLMNNNWRGLVIDGSSSHIRYIKESSFFWKYELTAVNSFITAENINQILVENGFNGKIGLLSIDIDGNDYWVWQAITVASADIVIVEYNSLFGVERAITVPYEPNFYRGSAHYSNLYFGASLPALYDLAKSKGYSFIGCNQAGNNAYFIKNDLCKPLSILSLSDGFVKARFREARSSDGKLSLLNEEARKKEIKGLPVINTRTGNREVL